MNDAEKTAAAREFVDGNRDCMTPAEALLWDQYRATATVSDDGELVIRTADGPVQLTRGGRLTLQPPKRQYNRRTRVCFHWVDLKPEYAAGFTRIEQSVLAAQFVVRTSGDMHVFVVPPAEFSELLSEMGDRAVEVRLGDTGTVIVRVEREGRMPLLVTTPDAIRLSY